MDIPSVVIASNAPILWRALCAAGSADGLAPVQVPRDEDLAATVAVTAPTVLVIDLVDLTVNGRHEMVSALCTELSDSEHRPGVLLLADGVDDLGAVGFLRCGVRGVFSPDLPLGVFPKALRKIAEGESWWTRRQASAALESLLDSDRGTSSGGRRPIAAVTARERAVLELMSAGMSHLEIAEALGLTPSTARTHIRNVMHKLDAHTRTEAVQVALRSGLLDEPGGSTRPG